MGHSGKVEKRVKPGIEMLTAALWWDFGSIPELRKLFAGSFCARPAW